MSTTCNQNHSIRRGRQRDLPTGMMSRVGGGVIPSYVLFCDGTQVGAMDGNPGLIITITIFEPYRGMRHSEIFLDLLEQEARNNGITVIKTSSVSSPWMMRSLERKGFTQGADDEYSKTL